jgi:hypothetical protein
MQNGEKELQDKIAKYLSQFFIVEKEVWSIDHKKRIDIAMIHKTDIERKYPIGIEIKTFDKKTGSDAGKWMHQAQHYSELDFIGYGRMLIIIAPQFSENVFSEGKLMHKHISTGDASPDHNVATFLGQFHLGEFQRYNYENYVTHKTIRLARIVYKGLIIWNEYNNDFRPQNIVLRCKE